MNDILLTILVTLLVLYTLWRWTGFVFKKGFEHGKKTIIDEIKQKLEELEIQEMSKPSDDINVGFVDGENK